MNKNITCRLDNKTVLIKHLARHLKLHHNKDYKEYISEYLDDLKPFGWNKCPYSGKVVKGKVSPEFKDRYHSDITKGVPKGPMSDETKRKLSEGRKGEKHWNYGKTRDFMTDEIREKISKANKGKTPWLGKKHSIETKKKLSKIQLDYYKTHDGPMLGKTHSFEAIKKIFSHRPMNKLEKIVADELSRNNIEYYFQFFISDEIVKSYDFKIKNSKILLEIDGDFWHGNPKTKHHFTDCKTVQCNDKTKEELAIKHGYTLLRLWESDIKINPSIIITSLKEYLSV